MTLTLRDRSIAVRLPLGMAALLIAACGVLTAAVYVQVRQSVLAIAADRLSFAAHQIQGLLATSVKARRQGNDKVAANAAVTSYTANPTAEREAAVRAVLAAVPPGNGRSGWRVVDGGGRSLLTTKDWSEEPVDSARSAETLRTSTGVSEFLPTADGKSGFYDIVTPIKLGDARVGWLVERRWMAATAPNLPVIEGLIGSHARLFVGNVGGGFWTDFIKPIRALPSNVHESLAHYENPGGAFLVRGAVIDGTPWVVAAGLPLDPVMTPVRRFLLGALAITTAVVAAGTLVAWRFSRGITKPLTAVTEAAETIAADGRDDTPRAATRDELARLQTSFDAMATRVRESQAALAAMVDELELRVAARTADLESANRELQAFSYSVSHDLRAPVRAISGFIRILLEEHGHELSPDARRHLDVVTKRTRQMGQLIDDLLSLSQVGRRQVGRETVDMNRMIAEVAEEIRVTEPDRHIELRLADVPPAAGEGVLIRQMLVNLLQNAVKFTRTRPVATIETGAIENDGEVVYFVRDNGVGFPMQYSNRVFDPFHRLHTADDFEGTGIGLAIVHRIIAKHGGRVWAESAEGRGATFYFTLAARALEAA